MKILCRLRKFSEKFEKIKENFDKNYIINIISKYAYLINFYNIFCKYFLDITTKYPYSYIRVQYENTRPASFQFCKCKCNVRVTKLHTHTFIVQY